jgi:thioredoxin-related protein
VIVTFIFTSPALAAELVMFESEACEWCEVWDEEIGVVYDITNEAKVVPLRKVDIDDEPHADFRHLERIIYTPTFIIMDGGEEVGRIIGYPGEDFFWQFLNEILVKVNLIEGEKHESF